MRSAQVLTPAIRFSRGILRMEATDPFFSNILLNLRVKESNSIPTVCVTSKEITYNPDYISSVTESMLGNILAHEAMHIAFKHPLWLFKLPNAACAAAAAELAINSYIMDRLDFPADALIPGKGDYIDLPRYKNTEWYYYQLLKKQEEQEEEREDKQEEEREDKQEEEQEEEQEGKDKANEETKAEEDNNTQDKPTEDKETNTGTENATKGAADKELIEQCQKLGYVMPTDTKDEAGSPSEAELANDIDRIVIQSAIQAKSVGLLPGKYEEMLHSQLQPTEVPWRIILRNFMTKNIHTSLSYRRPARRSTHRDDIINPARYNKGLGHIVMGVDTSASMSELEMNKALSACIEICSQYRNFKLTLIQFDTQISNVSVYTDAALFNSDIKDWTWKGRGGTDYRDVIDSLDTHKPDCVLILTDGYPNMWPDVRKWAGKLLWLITDQNAKVPEDISKLTKVIRVK